MPKHFNLSKSAGETPAPHLQLNLTISVIKNPDSEKPGVLSSGRQIIPGFGEAGLHSVSFPRRACPRPDRGRESKYVIVIMWIPAFQTVRDCFVIHLSSLIPTATHSCRPNCHSCEGRNPVKPSHHTSPSILDSSAQYSQLPNPFPFLQSFLTLNGRILIVC